MLPSKFSVSLPEMAHLGDHVIAGKAMVPAVELLNWLVQFLDQANLRWDAPLTMGSASFPRFLPADELSRCTFEIALEESPAGGIRALLSSSIALAAGMRRQRIHADVTFRRDVQPMSSPPPEADAEYEIAAERVYRELIPFGPQFCNLRDTLRLTRGAAWATVRSPTPTHPNPSRAGCPYLLDSAMHLACVWGQRYAGLVAYPTGFSARTVFSPIPHGERRCTAALRSAKPRQLVFDLWLADQHGHVCDAIDGLVMAPLAVGAAPPAWIIEGGL